MLVSVNHQADSQHQHHMIRILLVHCGDAAIPIHNTLHSKRFDYSEKLSQTRSLRNFLNNHGDIYLKPSESSEQLWLNMIDWTFGR